MTGAQSLNLDFLNVTLSAAYGNDGQPTKEPSERMFDHVLKILCGTQ
jgi:hypothetical protein